ncbi:20754_t:CDS:2, partial [Cetraspora pellucida]
KISLNNEDNTEVSTHNEVSDQYKSNNKKVKHNDTRGGSEIRSWIWHYFNPEYENNIRVAICKVETVKGTKCGKKYKIVTSKSNCTTHLNNAHSITEEQTNFKNNSVSVKTPHNESRQLELSFKKFITELDSNFQIPNVKYIKKLIHRAYNYSFPLITEKHVIADVSTHWNSSYLAWCRLLELKGYIRILETNLAKDSNQDSKKDSQQLTKIMLTNDEWDLLCNLIPVLGPFEEVTRYLGGSNYATYSIMSPLLITILKMLKPASLTNETNEINIEKIEDIFVEIDEQDMNKQKKMDLDEPMQTSNTLEKVKETLYRAMLFYWKRDITSYLPSILDPCVKKIEFAPDKIDEIQELLKNKYYDMKNNSKVNPTTASTSTTSAQNLSNICSFPNSTLTTLYKPILFNIFNNLPTVNSQSELDEYLA